MLELNCYLFNLRHIFYTFPAPRSLLFSLFLFELFPTLLVVVLHYSLMHPLFFSFPTPTIVASYAIGLLFRFTESRHVAPLWLMSLNTSNIVKKRTHLTTRLLFQSTLSLGTFPYNRSVFSLLFIKTVYSQTFFHFLSTPFCHAVGLFIIKGKLAKRRWQRTR